MLGFDSLAALCRAELQLDGADVQAILSAKPGQTVGAVLGLHGGDRKSEAVESRLSDNLDRPTERGTGTDYILARLDRDGHQDLLKRVESGELKPKQAGRLAGFVPPLPTPYEQAVKLLPKLSRSDKRRLAKALAAELES